MARGMDTGGDPNRRIDPRLSEARRLSVPDASLRDMLKAQRANARYLFGQNYTGSVDDGRSYVDKPMPGGYSRNVPYLGDTSSPRNRPEFVNANPQAVQYANEQDMQEKAMTGLMQGPSDNAPMGNIKMVDMGMRESDGVERPVHSYTDERIKMDYVGKDDDYEDEDEDD